MLVEAAVPWRTRGTCLCIVTISHEASPSARGGSMMETKGLALPCPRGGWGRVEKCQEGLKAARWTGCLSWCKFSVMTESIIPHKALLLSRLPLSLPLSLLPLPLPSNVLGMPLTRSGNSFPEALDFWSSEHLFPKGMGTPGRSSRPQELRGWHRSATCRAVTTAREKCGEDQDDAGFLALPWPPLWRR